MVVSSMCALLNTLTTCALPFDDNTCGLWHGITRSRSKDFGRILSRVCNY